MQSSLLYLLFAVTFQTPKPLHITSSIAGMASISLKQIADIIHHHLDAGTTLNIDLLTSFLFPDTRITK